MDSRKTKQKSATKKEKRKGVNEKMEGKKKSIRRKVWQNEVS